MGSPDQVTRKIHIVATIYDKRGRILSIGANSYTKTHPMQAKYAATVGLPHKQYLHAEIAAILRLSDVSKAHRIKVERYDAKGNPANAKPCPICDHVIRSAGIKVVEWTK